MNIDSSRLLYKLGHYVLLTSINEMTRLPLDFKPTTLAKNLFD